MTPIQFVGEWEAAIDGRAGLDEDVGEPADNAYILYLYRRAGGRA